jgi:hypothetical protein
MGRAASKPSNVRTALVTYLQTQLTREHGAVQRAFEIAQKRSQRFKELTRSDEPFSWMLEDPTLSSAPQTARKLKNRLLVLQTLVAIRADAQRKTVKELETWIDDVQTRMHDFALDDQRAIALQEQLKHLRDIVQVI